MKYGMSPKLNDASFTKQMQQNFSRFLLRMEDMILGDAC